MLGFTEHAIRLARQAEGQLALLVRFQWIAGKRVASLLTEAKMHSAIVLTRRIRWFDNGGDSKTGQHHRVDLLRLCSAADRRAFAGICRWAGRATGPPHAARPESAAAVRTTFDRCGWLQRSLVRHLAHDPGDRGPRLHPDRRLGHHLPDALGAGPRPAARPRPLARAGVRRHHRDVRHQRRLLAAGRQDRRPRSARAA